ncbi:hypothetical protein AB6N24_08875 [Cellulomonas sp. 179-A 4D5 NHS]|uniref:hypothetical protein n=1 Tax=Cellulomonas sp. 179-A 4D5 NHS TaxID=3142378 RepID=UPI0039A09110
MTFRATVARVLIASPGDAQSERDQVEQTIHQWNAERSLASGIIFMPVRWETGTVPVLEGDGQSIVNRQIVDDADIVMAFFKSRIGTLTPRGISGTAEEILRSADASKPVHVWFSKAPHPTDVDTRQLDALRSFEKSLQDRGLLGRYESPEALAHHVRGALEHDIARIAALGRGDTHQPTISTRRSGPSTADHHAEALRAEIEILTGNAAAQGWTTGKSSTTTLRFESPKGRKFSRSVAGDPGSARQELRRFERELRSFGLRVNRTVRVPER